MSRVNFDPKIRQKILAGNKLNSDSQFMVLTYTTLLITDGNSFIENLLYDQSQSDKIYHHYVKP